MAAEAKDGKPWLLRLAGLRYLAVPSLGKLYPINTDLAAKLPSTDLDALRQRRAQLKRRRKAAQRLDRLVLR